MKRFRHWWSRKRTRIEPAMHNRHPAVIDSESWTGWDDAMVPGWRATRPGWDEWGSTYSVTAATAEEAVAKLDEWQEDAFRRPR